MGYEKPRTNINITALDSVIAVNSFFTFAIFIGVSSPTPGQSSLEGPKCNPDPGFAIWLFVFEVLSFGCFLISSLAALGLKLALLIPYSELPLLLADSMDKHEPPPFLAYRMEEHYSGQAPIESSTLKYGMIISIIGSFSGCLFLGVSMFLFIQIQLGIWSCGTAAIYISVCSLVLMVFIGLFVYARPICNSYLYWEKQKRSVKERRSVHTCANYEADE